MPSEVLEHILKFVPGYEIPDLTLVSKQFNEVISNSVKLMNNFEVQWDRSKDRGDMRPLLKSKRKYRKLNVLEITGIKPCFDRFITNHASTLTSIGFYDCAMTSTELYSILIRVASNLEEIDFCEVNFELDCDVKPIVMPKMKSMEIMYGRGDGYVSILNFFEGSKVEKFSYEDTYELDHEEAETIAAFILSLKDLTFLSLTSDVVLKVFADERFALSVTCQLEQVFLWINGPERNSDEVANDAVYRNICSFLHRQRKTLNILTLARCPVDNTMLSFVLKLDQLKDLRLVHSDFVSSEILAKPNKTIERLFISMQEIVEVDEETVICNLLENCANIRKLRFSHCHVTFEMSMIIAYKMTHLQKLEMYQCNLEVVSFPSLKKLEILNCDLEDVTKLVRVNRHLKHLWVPFDYRNSTHFMEAVNNDLSAVRLHYA